jgi:hypothetical protein
MDDMALAPVGLLNRMGAEAAVELAAKIEGATADAAITPAVPIRNFRRDSSEGDGREVVGMALLQK